MRTIIFATVALVACKNEKQAAQPSLPAMAPTARPASDCRGAATKLGELNQDTSHIDEVTRECETDRWSPELTACLARIDGAEALQACGRIAFEGVRLDFQPNRVIDVTDGNVDEQQPPMFTRDGDALVFRDRGTPCGMIGSYSGPAYATFLVCNGKVLAGPLVGEKEYLAAMELAMRAGLQEVKGNSDPEAAAFDLHRSIGTSLPSGSGTTTVYDRTTGRPLYQTY